MSWSLYEKGVVSSEVVMERLIELARANAKNSNPDGVDQAEAIAEIATNIIESGIVGNNTKRYTVSISGHGNPNHEPKSGWSNDNISIQITQES